MSREILKEASTPALTTVRNVLPPFCRGIARVGSGRRKSGMNGLWIRSEDASFRGRASRRNRWRENRRAARREPAEIGVRVEKLVEGIEPQRPVVLEAGVRRELSPEIGHARFAFVKNRSSEKRSPLDVEHHFGKPLGCLEEIIGLETGDAP